MCFLLGTVSYINYFKYGERSWQNLWQESLRVNHSRRGSLNSIIVNVYFLRTTSYIYPRSCHPTDSGRPIKEEACFRYVATAVHIQTLVRFMWIYIGSGIQRLGITSDRHDQKQVQQTDKQKLAASLQFCPDGEPESYRLLSSQVQNKITDRSVTFILRV